MEEIKAKETELTYEEALKKFKKEWADKRKQEKKKEKDSKRAEEREKDTEVVKAVIETLNTLSPKSKEELSAVFTRLNMFINGERYTRNMTK